MQKASLGPVACCRVQKVMQFDCQLVCTKYQLFIVFFKFPLYIAQTLSGAGKIAESCGVMKC